MATDGSKESAPAVRTAVELANGTGSELHVVHALSTAPKLPYPHYWERPRSNILRDRERVAAFTLLEEKLRQIEELGGIVAGSHYREGKPEEEVARLAEEIEVGLIVVGGRKVGGFASLFPTNFSEAVYGRALRSAAGARTESVARGIGEANRADDGPAVAFEHAGISSSMHRNVPVRVAAFGGTRYRTYGKWCTEERSGGDELFPKEYPAGH